MPGPAWLAIVLAGGGSERLGTDKTRVDVGGVSALDRVLAAVDRARCATGGPGPILCVGVERPTCASVEWVREQPPGSGPAAAVVTALGAVDAVADLAEVALVLAGDLPLLSAAVLSRLLEAGHAPVEADGARLTDASGRPQHLLGAYRLHALRRSAGQRTDWAGQSMRTLLAPLTLVDVPSRGAESLDLDTADDVDAARRLVRSPAHPTTEEQT